MLPHFLGYFSSDLIILAGNEYIHDCSEEFEVKPDLATDCGVSCPWASEKIPIDSIMGKTALPLFLGCFDRILFILVGNDDIHKSLDEFEIRPDLTTDCPLASKKRCCRF